MYGSRDGNMLLCIHFSHLPIIKMLWYFEKSLNTRPYTTWRKLWGHWKSWSNTTYYFSKGLTISKIMKKNIWHFEIFSELLLCGETMIRGWALSFILLCPVVKQFVTVPGPLTGTPSGWTHEVNTMLQSVYCEHPHRWYLISLNRSKTRVKFAMSALELCPTFS